jgi:DNA-binding transcriptional regulator YiaG
LSALPHSLPSMSSLATVVQNPPDACIAYDAAAVGLRLRRLRRSAGLTQFQLASSLGTAQPAVARLEAVRQRLSLQALQRAAAELGCVSILVISEQRGKA